MSENKAQDKAPAKAPVYKKWWFWVIIVVVLLGIGGVGASNSKDAKKVGEGESSTEVKTTEKQTFKMGDVVAIDDYEVTVQKVERNWSSTYSKPKEGKEYIKVSVTIVNKSDEEASYYTYDWKIEDGDGAIESSAIVLGDDDSIGSGKLAAGGKKSGSVVFEVPKDDQNLKVHYQPNLFTDRKAIISLSE